MTQQETNEKIVGTDIASGDSWTNARCGCGWSFQSQDGTAVMVAVANHRMIHATDIHTQPDSGARE